MDMVVMSRHLPEGVLDTEPAALAEHVGVDGVPESGVATDHDVEGPAARMIGQPVLAHSTDGPDAGVGGTDVLGQGPGVRLEPGTTDQRHGMGGRDWDSSGQEGSGTESEKLLSSHSHGTVTTARAAGE